MSNPTNDPAVIYATGAVSRNPATGELIATYPYQTPAEAEATLSANAAASYRRLAATLHARSETLASLITAGMRPPRSPGWAIHSIPRSR